MNSSIALVCHLVINLLQVILTSLVFSFPYGKTMIGTSIHIESLSSFKINITYPQYTKVSPNTDFYGLHRGAQVTEILAFCSFILSFLGFLLLVFKKLLKEQSLHKFKISWFINIRSILSLTIISLLCQGVTPLLMQGYLDRKVRVMTAAFPKRFVTSRKGEPAMIIAILMIFIQLVQLALVLYTAIYRLNAPEQYVDHN